MSSAYYLLQKELIRNSDAFPLVLEASSRLGGWIHSHKLENGTIFEQGPRTIRPKGETGANTLKLVEELGIQNEITPITSGHPAAQNRMIYANGQLHKLPSNLASIFKKQTPFSKSLIRLLSKDLYTSRKIIVQNDESIYDFINRRFGNEVADYLISPLLCGICGGNAKEISVKFLMESLFQKEQSYGSITRGLIVDLFQFNKDKSFEKCKLYERALNERWSIYSFNNGIETLINALGQHITSKGVNINCDVTCRSIKLETKHAKLNMGSEILKTKHLISSVPAKELAKLIKYDHPDLSNLLSQIKPVSLGVVNLEYSGKLIEQEGFGVLVAPKENLPILGVIYDSCCFPRGDKTVLTVMMGGYWFKEHFGDKPDDNLLYETAVEQVGNILGIKQKPSEFRVNVLYDAIPQYTVGHSKRIQEINACIRADKLPLSLCGASYNGVGVNDVILSSRRVVDRLYAV